MDIPGDRTKWLNGSDRIDFTVCGKTATVIVPAQPLPGRFWAWKAEFLDAFPAVEFELLHRGMYVVFLSFPDQFGSEAAVEAWNVLYDEFVKSHRFAPKPALIGLSRGGLYCYAWAAANPEKVACIYADAPVCDISSWPGGKGSGEGSPEEWARVFDVFGFASEAEAAEYARNPIDVLEPLAKSGVPLLHVYGESDTVVPWEENTGVLAERYRGLGGQIKLIGKPGCGHHPHGLSDPTPIADFIFRHTVEQPLDKSR